jgi:Tfp pilus assembly protein PilV
VLVEVMVALVLLGVVAVGYLELVRSSHRLVTDARVWGRAVDHAADALERVKLEPQTRRPDADETLPGGFGRQVATRPWQPGLELLTVTVVLPDGQRFVVNGLTTPPAPGPTASGPVTPAGTR